MNTQELQTVDIPLKKLLAWEENVRTTTADEGLQELTASIRSMGLLQSLVVKKAPRGKFAVVAGKRRLQALSQLSESGDIPAAFAVPCRVLTGDADLTEISLAENVVRTQMHPADEFEAFNKLLTSGKSAVDIAARFGVSEAVVLRRLALSRVSPTLIQQYRNGAMNLETLQVFTLTDDRNLQQQVWKQLQSWNRNAETVRNLLSKETIEASDKRVQFVGLSLYEAEGGPVLRDLFAEGNDGVYIQDAVLLDRLVTDKLNTLAEDLRREGWKWVEVRPDGDRQLTARLRRLPAERTQLPAKRQAKLDALQREQAGLEAQLSADEEASEDGDDPRYQRLEEIEREIEKIESSRKNVYSPETRAVSGAVIALGWNGEAECTYGLLRKEDEAALKKERGQDKSHDDSGQPSSFPEDDEKPAYSAPLVEFLTTHKTAAIAAELCQNTRIALVAVVHALVLEHLFHHNGFDHRAKSCFQISTTGANLDPIKESSALAVLNAQATHWTAQLPKQSVFLWDWLLQQDQDALLQLLAFCAATTVNAIKTKTDYDGNARFAHADALAMALGMDMTRWFTPTAENFFDRISKAKILEALTEAGKEAGPIKRGMKKGELAKAAEFDLAGSDWLPQPLRISPERMGTVADTGVEDDTEQDIEGGGGDK